MTTAICICMHLLYAVYRNPDRHTTSNSSGNGIHTRRLTACRVGSLGSTMHIRKCWWCSADVFPANYSISRNSFADERMACRHDFIDQLVCMWRSSSFEDRPRSCVPCSSVVLSQDYSQVLTFAPLTGLHTYQN